MGYDITAYLQHARGGGFMERPVYPQRCECGCVEVKDEHSHIPTGDKLYNLYPFKAPTNDGTN